MMGDAVPQTPWDLPLLFSRMDVFRFTRNGACPTIDLLARRIGLSRDGTRAPMQVRNGGGLRAALLVSPLLHLRMDDFLSNRWGPPQVVVRLFTSVRMLTHGGSVLRIAFCRYMLKSTGQEQNLNINNRLQAIISSCVDIVVNVSYLIIINDSSGR
jgi:hypothetical protein